jgi:hypothetical protein
MTRSDAVWYGILAAGGAYEAHALRHRLNDDTLSAFTRRSFRTRTHRVGRAAFAVSWVGFSAWYLRHILREEGISP